MKWAEQIPGFKWTETVAEDGATTIRCEETWLGKRYEAEITLSAKLLAQPTSQSFIIATVRDWQQEIVGDRDKRNANPETSK